MEFMDEWGVSGLNMGLCKVRVERIPSEMTVIGCRYARIIFLMA